MSLTEAEKRYRSSLTQKIERLDDSFDKLVVALSGGALAVSITFLKDVLGLERATQPFWLLLAWVMFITSMASILLRIYFGIKANRRAIEQFDACVREGTSFEDRRPGGRYSKITRGSSIVALTTLLLGLLFIAWFSYKNLGV